MYAQTTEYQGWRLVGSTAGQREIETKPTSQHSVADVAARSYLAGALKRQGGNAEAKQRLAMLWVGLYRIRARQQPTEALKAVRDDSLFWSLTDFVVGQIAGRARL